MQALTDFLLPLFLALGSLWFVVDLLKKIRAPAPRTEPAPAPALTPAPALPPALPPAHLAVIAATVHHLYRGRARITAVVAATPGSHSAVDWAREGRRDIFSSHRLR